MQTAWGPAVRRSPPVRGACAVALAALVAGAAAPASAHAARPHADRVCAPSAALYESPDGLRIGVVAGGRTVIVLRRTASGKWVRIRTTIGARGWVKARTLCDEGA